MGCYALSSIRKKAQKLWRLQPTDRIMKSPSPKWGHSQTNVLLQLLMETWLPTMTLNLLRKKSYSFYSILHKQRLFVENWLTLCELIESPASLELFTPEVPKRDFWWTNLTVWVRVWNATSGITIICWLDDQSRYKVLWTLYILLFSQVPRRAPLCREHVTTSPQIEKELVMVIG